jgi:Mrp family chromosome partitioning ATPase
MTTFTVIPNKEEGAMAEAVTESLIYEELEMVVHPEIQKQNLVELGMIAGVRVDGNRVNITVTLPYLKVPFKDELVQSIQDTVLRIDAELEVDVDIQEMSSQQKKKFLARAKQDQTGSLLASQIGCVLAVMSGKGGVGKSSITGLLAASLRRRNYRVGVLDADVTGPSIPKIFGAHQQLMAGPHGPMPVESSTGIKLISINLVLAEEGQAVIWRGPMVSKVIEQFWRDIAWGQIDYLIVDLPPGTSDAALTVMQSLPLNGIVLVTSPQDLAGMVVRKAANMATTIGIPMLGLIENMSYLDCPECHAHIEVFGPSQTVETARQAGLDRLGNLPLDPDLAVMCDRGKVEEYRREVFESIVDQILELEPARLPEEVRAKAQASRFAV